MIPRKVALVAARASREEVPRFGVPMLARRGPLPQRENGWTAEVKWDGFRLQLRADGRRICLRTRPGRDCIGEFSS